MTNVKTKVLPFIIFVTGASGAGKTTLINKISRQLPTLSTVCLHFDGIGVPSEEHPVPGFDNKSVIRIFLSYNYSS